MIVDRPSVHLSLNQWFTPSIHADEAWARSRRRRRMTYGGEDRGPQPVHSFWKSRTGVWEPQAPSIRLFLFADSRRSAGCVCAAASGECRSTLSDDLAGHRRQRGESTPRRDGSMTYLHGASSRRRRTGPPAVDIDVVSGHANVVGRLVPRDRYSCRCDFRHGESGWLGWWPSVRSRP
jgi:hypothetical protein